LLGNGTHREGVKAKPGLSFWTFPLYLHKIWYSITRGETELHVRFTAENIFLATQKYRNWREVITSIAKRQDFTKVVLKNGIQIEVPEGEGLKRLMNQTFFKKDYNPPNLEIGCNDIVVDIGAHFGVFTFFAACITHNTVYAFEPSPSNFEILERNIRINTLKNIIANNFAVSDKNGLAKFLLYSKNNQGNILADHFINDKLDTYRDSVNHQFDHIIHSNKIEEYNEIEVSTTTLQLIMDNYNIEYIDFLKMDCEGSEGPILNSTPKEYLNRVRKIAMEFHDHLSQFTHTDIQKLLEESGFSTNLKWDHKSPIGFLYAWRK